MTAYRKSSSLYPTVPIPSHIPINLYSPKHGRNDVPLSHNTARLAWQSA